MRKPWYLKKMHASEENKGTFKGDIWKGIFLLLVFRDEGRNSLKRVCGQSPPRRRVPPSGPQGHQSLPKSKTDFACWKMLFLENRRFTHPHKWRWHVHYHPELSQVLSDQPRMLRIVGWLGWGNGVMTRIVKHWVLLIPFWGVDFISLNFHPGST